MATLSLLSLRSVSKTFAGPRNKEVLHNVSLELAAGEYIAIVGESGVGKSTLLNVIAGLDKPDSGDVIVADVNLATLNDDALTELRREKIGFVFQAFHVLPYLNVARNIVLPLSLQDVAERQAVERVLTMLEAVGLRDRAESLPRELSGGELQRVAIARALIHQPKLVLADEPTGNLDRDNASQVLSLMRERVKASGAAAILVTHSDRAARSADRIFQLTPEGLLPVVA